MIPSLILALCVQTESRGLRWPLGGGPEPYPLRATYGQLEGSVGGSFHYGVDILPRAMGDELEPVKAVEAGTVLRVRKNSNELNAVLVESDAYPGRAFLYLHLDQAVAVRVGDHVAAGGLIGRLAQRNTDTGEPHLHLSRLGGGYRSHTWGDMSTLSVENPLVLLKKPAGADDGPRFARFPGNGFFKLRSDDGLVISSVEESSADVAVSASSTTGVLKDVVVRAFDVDRESWHLLAPYKLSLEISSANQTATFRTIVLGGKLDEDDNDGLYSLALGTRSKGITEDRRYDYFYVLTNSGQPGSSEHAWRALPGTYLFRARIEDAYGNTDSVEETVQFP